MTRSAWRRLKAKERRVVVQRVQVTTRRKGTTRTGYRNRGGAKGFSAVGPMPQIGTTWGNSKVDAMSRLSLGTTLPGKNAAAKVLNPACNLGPQQWPDKSANETLTLQNTDVWNLNAGTTAMPWRANIWLTPFIDCPMITSTTVLTDPYPNPAEDMEQENCAEQQQGTKYGFWYSSQWRNQTDPTKHPGQDYQTARITARSITIDLIANATTNQGVIYAAQFSPNIEYMAGAPTPELKTFLQRMIRDTTEATIKTTLDLEMLAHKSDLDKMAQIMVKFREDLDKFKDLPHGDPSRDYTCAKAKALLELTRDLSGSEEYRVLEEKYQASAPAVDDVEELATVFDRMVLGKPSAAPSGSQTGFRVVFQDFPYDPQGVMQVSTGSYMAKADMGAYMVLKHSSDTLPFQATSMEAFLSARVPHALDNKTSYMNVLHQKGWNGGCLIVDGLHENAILNIKVITCLEFTARSDSTMAKYAREAPPLDKVAIDHTRAAMGQLKDCYPSADNALGGIVNEIAAALEKSGIPIVSQVAGFARNVNRMTGGMGTRLLDKIF